MAPQLRSLCSSPLHARSAVYRNWNNATSYPSLHASTCVSAVPCLPATHKSHSSLPELAASNKKSWVKDVLTAATKLPFACPPLDFANATPKSVEEYRKNLGIQANRWLQHEVDSSVELYLLHGRREPQKDKPATQITLYLPHYLSMVRTQSHREALTSIMLSTHRLALGKLWHTDHAHQPVPRHERVCRFCMDKVESPEHALLECQSNPDVLKIRSMFMVKLFHTVPRLQPMSMTVDSTAFLKAIIYEHSTIVLTGKFVHDVLEVFYATEVYRRR